MKSTCDCDECKLKKTCKKKRDTKGKIIICPDKKPIDKK